MQNSKRPAKYTKRRAESVKITLTLPKGLLNLADQAAVEDYTTRSDIMRTALLWYLRPQGRHAVAMDDEEIFKTLRHRKTRASVNQWLKDEALDAD